MGKQFFFFARLEESFWKDEEKEGFFKKKITNAVVLPLRWHALESSTNSKLHNVTLMDPV